MIGFCGSLDCASALTVGPDSPAPAAIDELGCRALLRGFVANRVELRRRLGVADGRCESDDKLAAHAFRAWGADLPRHVLGEYAAVVIDDRAGSALLTHDSLGLRPLFYAVRGDRLAFSTHLVDLIDQACAAELDDEYLADFLALGRPNSARTPYRSIKRLLPGNSLVWAAGKARVVTHWDLAKVPLKRLPEEALYEEEFRSLIGAGVEGALATSGSVWTELSGGLDSSTVTCLAARLEARGLAALSVIAPSYPESDEQRWMRAVAEHCGLAWHPIDVEDMLPFTRLPNEFFGEPTGAVIDGQQRHLRNELLRAHGVTVLLTGHGGDNVLCASPGVVPVHLADALFDGRPIAAARAVADWKRGAAQQRPITFWMQRALLEPTLDHLRGRRVFARDDSPRPPWIDPEYERRMRLQAREGRRLAPRCRHPGHQHLWDRLWATSMLRSVVPQFAGSCEIRHPLLYRPLVEFMAAIPWEVKLRPRCDRYLQRRALKGLLPEAVRRRGTKTTGSRAFIEGLQQSPEWCDYMTDEVLLAERGIVAADRWRIAVRQATVGQTYEDRQFETFVAAEVWLKQLRDWRDPLRRVPR